MTTSSQVVPLNTVTQIPLDLLDASPNNPRKTFDEASLQELAASIRNIGISQPLIVRPEPMDEGLVEQRYEIVAGHRRSEAATLAGLEEAPCIVRQLTDQEAAELALVDNLQRVDVPALEEAEAFGKLLDLHGTVEAVAARVGKEVSHVAKRLKLRALGVWQRDALREGLITVDHALLLARLGGAEQDAALKWALDRNAGSKTSVEKVIAERIKVREDRSRRHTWHWEAESPQRLKEHIEQSTGRKLSRAPWSLDDAELVTAVGACSSCPSNTKANTALFADLDIDAATCADGACFELKRTVFVQLQLNRAKVLPGDSKNGVGVDALRVSWKSTSTPPRMLKGFASLNTKGEFRDDKPDPKQIFKDGQWVEAKKKSCEHARAAVTVDWSDANERGYMGAGGKLRKPGEILQVCVEPKCKAHPKDYARPKSKTTSNRGGYDEAAEKAKREAAEAERIAVSKIRLEIASRALAGIKNIPAGVIRKLALEAVPQHDFGLRPYEAVLPGIRKIIATAKADSVEFAKAVALSSIETGELTLLGGWAAKETQKAFVEAMARLGYDASKDFEKPKPVADAKAKLAAKKPAKTAAKKTAKKKGGR
jgi:ParB/RepB/Spo0J family partition protein